jgi:hypothetical protein
MSSITILIEVFNSLLDEVMPNLPQGGAARNLVHMVKHVLSLETWNIAVREITVYAAIMSQMLEEQSQEIDVLI